MYMSDYIANEPLSVNVGGFKVNSDEELELVQEYNLVRGHEIKVINPQGLVQYENLRAFAPLGEGVHLFRDANGEWFLLRRMEGINLKYGNKVAYFGKDGKIHLDQHCPYCESISV